MNKIIRLSIFCYLLLASTLLTADGNLSTRIVGGTESPQNSWPFMTALMYKKSGLSINSQSFDAPFLRGTLVQNFSGTLVNCGMGLEICENASNNVCLIERGGQLSNGEFSTFTNKITNCLAGGGMAAIIYNNVSSSLNWVAEAKIPGVAVSRNDGLSLLNHLGHTIQYGLLNTIPTRSFCGGSYLGGRWVVTAAHCVDGTPADLIVLNIGGTDLSSDQENIFYVEKIITSKTYIEENADLPPRNDFAIIELKIEPQGITPVQIADEAIIRLAIENNLDVTVIGRGSKNVWDGVSTPTAELSDPLLYDAKLSLIDNETCNSVMNDLISDDMICAGNLAGGIGSCQGDSGGPLVVRQAGNDYLIGITSWGFGCAQANAYGAYVRVPYFSNEIKTVMSPEKNAASLSALTIILLLLAYGLRQTIRHGTNPTDSLRLNSLI